MSDRNEEKLIALLKQRDERAFEELIRTHGGTVYNIAFRMMGNHAEAEDISQEIFITVFKRIDSFRGDSSLSTWLYRVAINHCKNRIKYMQRRHDQDRKEYTDSRPAITAGSKATGGTFDRPDDLVEAMETEKHIQRTLETMDEDHRTILVLREIECMSYEQIGEIMKLEAGTVKSKLHRARSAFMSMMKGLQGIPGGGGGDPGKGEG